MVSTCFYFQVHQPHRVKEFSVFDIGRSEQYFNDTKNREIMDRVAKKCYLPTNAVLLELLERHPKFRASFSVSGTALEQFERFSPQVLESFRKLVDTDRVEMLDETYYHSLAFLHSPAEFREQVKMHREKVQDLFGLTPEVFRNTELIYNNDVAREVEKMGYKAILAEGADSVLGWQSPNFVYRPKGADIRLLLKNYRLSDDIAFRFSNQDWKEWPLSAEKFSSWVSAINGGGQCLNLFMDYETFGEHQWASTGIFNFLRAMPGKVLEHKDNDFVTPSELISRHEPAGEIDVPHLMSWADVERDLSAWLGNDMQRNAIAKIYEIEHAVKASGNPKLVEAWRKLQTSDHFYYMCTKWFSDGDVHKYFNPYENPYEAFIAYMNIISDLQGRLAQTRPIVA